MVRPLLLCVSCLATLSLAAGPADAPLERLALEGARTPLGRELTSLSGESLGVAQALSQTTELAISPLLTLTAISAWRWFKTEPAARAALSFYAQPWFWGPALALLLLVFFKEAFVARIPGAKKPLDALQLVENKASGLIASPLAVGALAAAIHRSLQAVDARQVAGVFIGTAQAAHGPSAFVALPDALSWTFAVVGALTVYVSVWMASHTINVLILLSPFGVVDNALKLLRVALLLGVALLARWVPLLGAAVCAGLVLVAVLMAGFSWRLLRFGWSFSTGLLRSPARPEHDRRLFAFSGPALPLPVRTAGWLSLEGEHIVFRYRRLFVLPRQLVVASGLRVERGLLHPAVLAADGRLAFRLTPRLRGQEEVIARMLGSLPVEELAVLRGLKGIGAWLRGALAGDVGTQLDG
ncbi:MAG: hypothetical protein ACOZQL_04435 [Myxococcota bacterium]